MWPLGFIFRASQDSVRSDKAVPWLYGAGFQPLLAADGSRPGASPRAGMRARFQRSLCRFRHSGGG